MPLSVPHPGSPNQARRQVAHNGFTLIELLVSIAIVAILLSFLVVGLRQAGLFAQRTADVQTVAGLKTSVEQFKNDFGFLPPMVIDDLGRPTEPNFSGAQGPVHDFGPSNGGLQPVTYLGTRDSNRRRIEAEYLRGAKGGSNSSFANDYRYSDYSLAFYLAGALGADVDGVDGPGYRAPQRDGFFKRTGNSHEATFIPNPPGTDIFVENAQEYRLSLVDRNGVPFRYYRWEHEPKSEVSGAYEAKHLNVPKIFGLPQNDADFDVSPASDDPELRDAKYAIVAAGPNGVFGDFGTEDPNVVLDAVDLPDDAATYGIRAQQKGREDNVVEVGK